MSGSSKLKTLKKTWCNPRLEEDYVYVNRTCYRSSDCTGRGLWTL